MSAASRAAALVGSPAGGVRAARRARSFAGAAFASSASTRFRYRSMSIASHLERHVVVGESERRAAADSLVVDHRADPGCAPGAVVDGEPASVPPGAVGGSRRARDAVPRPHRVRKPMPDPVPDAGANARAWAGFVRLWIHCHFAHRRSTFACSRKNSGSRAAVSIELDEPWRSSRGRGRAGRPPCDERLVRRVRRCAAERDRLGLVQDARCRVWRTKVVRTIPSCAVGAPGSERVPGGELKPAGGVRDAHEALVNTFGAGRSNRQYGSVTLGSIACNSRSRSSR